MRQEAFWFRSYLLLLLSLSLSSSVQPKEEGGQQLNHNTARLLGSASLENGSKTTELEHHSVALDFWASDLSSI